MKIGILSMQRIINYGSFLQAYALSNTIRSLGHEVEFVDFKIEKCAVEPAPKLTINDVDDKYKNIFIDIQNSEKYFANEILKELGVHERNERSEVDTLVVGSDEVFNCLQKNSDVGCSLELFGKDHNAQKIISYAVSCGDTTYERICNHNMQEEISELLNGFSSISVRDENSRHFVENLSNIRPINHLDPVLIYDFSDVIQDNVNIDNYIIAYGYAFNFSDEECARIKEFAKKHNKKIVSFTFCYQKCADIVIDAHPMEVLAYFKKADFVITNTFHGTIFSVKMHTPFISFTRNYNTQKLADLIKRLGFQDRQVFDLNNIDSKYNEKIDFSKCDELLKLERQKSLEYLKENL